MLVLSRKTDERIVIGDNIEVTVVEVRGDRVKLAFRAPDSVRILREEVYQRIEKSLPPFPAVFEEPAAPCILKCTI